MEQEELQLSPERETRKHKQASLKMPFISECSEPSLQKICLYFVYLFTLQETFTEYTDVLSPPPLKHIDVAMSSN